MDRRGCLTVGHKVYIFPNKQRNPQRRVGKTAVDRRGCLKNIHRKSLRGVQRRWLLLCSRSGPVPIGCAYLENTWRMVRLVLRQNFYSRQRHTPASNTNLDTVASHYKPFRLPCVHPKKGIYVVKN